MNLDDIIDQLNALTNLDPEADHLRADDLLVEALLLFRQTTVVSAYKAASKRGLGSWFYS